MTDVFDQASEREDKEREEAIQAVRNSNTMLPATGRCCHCEAYVGGEMRFCDADCRDAWEFNQRMQTRLGR